CAAAGRAEALRALSAGSLGWSHGGRLRARAGVQARPRDARTAADRDRTGRHRGLHPAARRQCLRRSDTVARPEQLPRDRAVVPQLREISAVAALPDDDAWARADPARAVGA